MLFEDDSTNRMTEAINLFYEICTNPFFKKTSMVLLLNKRDLFKDKVCHTCVTTAINSKS